MALRCPSSVTGTVQAQKGGFNGRAREICMGIHSIKDYARCVANKAIGLREDGTKYTIPEKVDALSKRIPANRAKDDVSR